MENIISSNNNENIDYCVECGQIIPSKHVEIHVEPHLCSYCYRNYRPKF
jgi:hypothetical protein